jgi:hypothetical protein
MSAELRHTETENGYCAHYGFPRLEQGISRACRCIFHCMGDVLAQPGEGDIDHLLYFSSRKLSTAEINYTTT